ncbi:hypothetical protein K9N68_33775 [Kovacikia minuta CCNUW1]|uniref:hypothetical protein n=1 Tax=Kovacikia minuta TaxID=2931930 RepID=UPI001CCC58C2|nr:hypothetical protein [Kovacikia minuta]UBF26413.1 hypothetical protein K9N68_33775 [Kovacikia minuta CCNUW1]
MQSPTLGDFDKQLPKTAQELLNRLETECPELLLLIKSAPIRLVGKQRTGKSTFAKKLALLRSILLPGHQVAWATPHREADSPVPDSLNPFGTTPDGAKCFPAIEAVWNAIQQEVDRGKQLNLTAAWDEFGSYDQFQDEQALGKSLRSLLRESSKHAYFPILIAHGDQASFYPGVKGILGTLQESTVKVETIGKVKNVFGEMAPTGVVEVTKLDGSVSKFKVPDWLTVDLLLSLQPTCSKPAVLDAIALVKSRPQQTKPVGNSNEFEVADKPIVVSQSDEETPTQKIGRKLAEKLKAANGEWVSYRELVSRTFRTIEDKDLAHKILDYHAQKGTLEKHKTENQNGTATELYRLKPTVPF